MALLVILCVIMFLFSEPIHSTKDITRGSTRSVSGKGGSFPDVPVKDVDEMHLASKLDMSRLLVRIVKAVRKKSEEGLSEESNDYTMEQPHHIKKIHTESAWGATEEVWTRASGIGQIRGMVAVENDMDKAMKHAIVKRHRRATGRKPSHRENSLLADDQKVPDDQITTVDTRELLHGQNEPELETETVEDKPRLSVEKTGRFKDHSQRIHTRHERLPHINKHVTTTAGTTMSSTPAGSTTIVPEAAKTTVRIAKRRPEDSRDYVVCGYVRCKKVVQYCDHVMQDCGSCVVMCSDMDTNSIFETFCTMYCPDYVAQEKLRKERSTTSPTTLARTTGTSEYRHTETEFNEGECKILGYLVIILSVLLMILAVLTLCATYLVRSNTRRELRTQPKYYAQNLTSCGAHARTPEKSRDDEKVNMLGLFSTSCSDVKPPFSRSVSDGTFSWLPSYHSVDEKALPPDIERDWDPPSFDLVEEDRKVPMD